MDKKKNTERGVWRDGSLGHEELQARLAPARLLVRSEKKLAFQRKDRV
jgi:hypothetical protein